MKKSSHSQQGRKAPSKLLIVHHRHTGHLTHRRTTSYPMLVMIVLCVGVFLAGWTRHVTAADPFVFPGPVSNEYTVHASVPGPPPTVAATIDSPTEGNVFTSLPISVSGTCPLDTYVTLYRNGAFSGVALCQADGNWQLETGLFVGVNQLTARVFSQTDVPGPLSDITTVKYEPPQPAGNSGTTPASGSTSKPSAKSSVTDTQGNLKEPLIFKTIFKYAGHYVGDPASWQVKLEGGTPPYAISVNWGDGAQELISRRDDSSFTLEHTYKKAGAYKGHYVIKLSGSDTEDNQAFLQLLTIVNNPSGGAAGVTKPSEGGGATPEYLTNLFKYIWPSYAIVVLMLLSFWLGERREYHLLLPRLRKGRTHHA